MGNIGEPQREIELEPLPETEPVREPSPGVQPPVPAPSTPAPEPERVPA